MAGAIREIDEPEAVKQFFGLIAELECGDHFDPSRPQHVSLVRRIIAAHTARGARYYACYLDDGTPAGILVLLIDEWPEKNGRTCGQRAEILDLGLFEPYRSKGYGAGLLRHVEQVCRAAGLYCLYVATYARNHRAIAFYGRHGLVPVAALPDVNGPGDDGMVYMRKLLI